MKYAETIAKEEIATLPLLQFPLDNIFLIDTLSAYEKARPYLMSAKVLGFDTESRPSFKKGQHFPISLLQLATEDYAFLFRLNRVSLPKEVIQILEDPNIIKAGVAIRDDIIGLQKIIKFTPAGFIELVDLAKLHGIKSAGLRALVAIILGYRISKKAQLSNWAKEDLQEFQQIYAATDAWSGFKLYQKLKTIP